MFHKKKLGAIIRSSGTKFYSLEYLNSRIGLNALKYLYTVISILGRKLAIVTYLCSDMSRQTCPKSTRILKANHIYFWLKNNDVNF